MALLTTEKFMWLAIVIYWMISSVFVKKSVKKQSGWQRILYIAGVLLAFSLLFEDYFHSPFLYSPLLPQNEYWKTAGLALCVAGLAFAFSARIYLGRNWSGRITIKEGCLLIKISKEEKFMQEAFGEKWKVYRSKVKRLIPWLMLFEIFPLFQ